MPDVFANITEAPREALEVIMEALERRAADPQLQAMLEAYLSQIDLPSGAQALEVGSGTGPVARKLAGWPDVERVVGVDPSPVFLAKAAELARGIENLSFEEGDGRSIPFDDETFDLVVTHTLLCHVPGPGAVLDEARRVLRPGGTLALFDCDFSTVSISTGEFDPFQSLVDVMVDSIVYDRWFVRGMINLLRSHEFTIGPLRSYVYTEHPDPGFFYGWIERGTDALMASGRLGEEGSQGLRAEGDRRVEAKEWFAQVCFASVIAGKPLD